MWKIKSKSREGLEHIVEFKDNEWICDCEYYNFKGWRRGTCNHIKEVQDLLNIKREEKMDNKIGALWLKESSKGKKYFSGQIELNGEKTQIVVFKNNKDGVETRPDYQIFKSKPKRDEVVTARDDDDISVDQIPF